MSSSAAVLNVQAPKTIEEENRKMDDAEIRGRDSPDSTEKFNTWKDSGSNPKIQKNSAKFEKISETVLKESLPLSLSQSMKVQSSKSNFERSSSSFQRPNGCDAGPRAWFLSLPEMEEELPEASHLAAWIDRSRRFLSASVMTLEKSENEKRKKLWRDKEIMEISMEEEGERRGREKGKENDGGSGSVASSSKDGGGKRVRTFSVSTIDTHSPNSSRVPILSSFGSADKALTQTQILTQTQTQTQIQTDSEGPAITPSKTVILSDDNMEEYEESPIRSQGDGRMNPNGAGSGSDSGGGREFKVSEMVLQRLARNQMKENQETNRGSISNSLDVAVDLVGKEADVQSQADKKGKKTVKRRNVSFSFDSLEVTGGQGEKGEVVAPSSAPLAAAIRVLNRTDSAPLVTIDVNMYSNSNSPCYLPSGVSSLETSPTAPSQSSPSSATTNSSSSFFSPMNGGSEDALHTTHATSTSTPPLTTWTRLVSPHQTNENVSPVPSSLSSISISAVHSNSLPPISPFSTNSVCVVNPPYRGPTPSPVTPAIDSHIIEVKIANVAVLYAESDMKDMGVVGVDAGTDKKKGVELSIAASNYSPFREPGNGKSWLEQVLKITDKPLRKTNPRIAHRGIAASASTSALTSESQKSSAESIDSELSATSTARTTERSFRPQAPPLLPFINGMTHTETVTVRKLLIEIRKYSSTFCNGFSEPDAWKKYVKYNRLTNDDEFFPDVRTAVQNHFLF